jgi:hypothetical protein
MEPVCRFLRKPRCFGSSSRHFRIPLVAVITVLLYRSLFSVVGLHDLVSVDRVTKVARENGQAFLLSQQVREQEEIQAAIYKNQHPENCNTTRLLLRGGGLRLAKDGFASEIQYIARLLQMAVSTHRALVLTPEWRSAYEPSDCASRSTSKQSVDSSQSVEGHGQGWTCLWQPLTSCHSITKAPPEGDAVVVAAAAAVPLDDLEFPAGHGILLEQQQLPSTSKYFQTKYYGPESVVWAPQSFVGRPTELADVLAHWERAHGRFWVRAQMAHFMWRPSGWLQHEIEHSVPPALVKHAGTPETPFIGFHIRKTDNIADFRKAFSRNATLTRSFDRFMAFAEEIRSSFPDKHIETIYLATDNSAVIEESKRTTWQQLGWKFVFQTNVQRTTAQDRMWFRDGRSTAAGAIGTDLEVLRRADFLVGSFQSNVYRLAAELNSAWHAANYSWSLRRHWTVDVEWYEDP